jgi:tetratricopeptide (TPR) repeat protein
MTTEPVGASTPAPQSVSTRSAARARSRRASPPALTLVRGLLVVAAILLAGLQPVLLPVARDLQIAQAATAAKNYAAAADALSNAAERLPYAGDLINQTALAEISAARFDAAIRDLFAAADLDGWTAARHVALGDAYVGKGDASSALAQWELALPGAPKDDALLARLANQYEALGRYPDAIRVLTTLTEVRRADPAVFYRLALLTAATSPADAPARLVIVADMAPNLASSTRMLVDAIQSGQATGNPAYTFGRVGYAFEQLNEWRLAEEALTRAVGIDPQYADAYAYLGLAQDRQNKDGLVALQTAVKLAPQSPLAQYLLGLHWRRAGDSHTALIYLQTAQALDPQNPAIAAEMGGAYASLGDLTNAEIWLTEAVKRDDKNPQFWLLLANFYVDNDYHVAELGLPAARMAAGLAPKSGPAADALGFALVLTGDLANGERMLLQALTLGGESAATYYHLGILYTRQKRAPEAEAALNHALSLDPQGFYGNLALKALGTLTKPAP